ncbi:MAG: rRNA maturation RNase YbeY [Planctomycetota bacterium]|nr:rRNA maturation RNase YbeY [Planctomycetota bacterium]
MSASVEVSVHDTRVPGGRRRLEADLRRLGDYVARRAARPVELSFAILDDERMQTVNRETLAHDYPTDVLSFPMASEPVLMGEVLLSADTARREAAERGHPAYHELLLYAVHGVLHLLGYDDHDPTARRRMRRAERAALAALDVPPVFGRGR